ncbi:hypothetical protein ACSQ67_011757 [Phaseolus vulgaris]
MKFSLSVRFSSEFEGQLDMDLNCDSEPQMALTLFHVKLNCCSQQKLIQSACLSGCIGRDEYGGRRRVTAPPAGWGKVKRNGSVCLGGNEQGPLDQKG